MTEQATQVSTLGATTPLAPTTRIRLSGQQGTLIRALEQLDINLSRMYHGGLTVLEVDSNPDRFAQCAHSIRELMEKLPEKLDVPTPAQKENLKGKMREIEDSYQEMQKKTHCLSVSSGWEGNIDKSLRKFLLKLDSFFKWFASHHPRRRNELYSVLVRLDGSGRTLPKSLLYLVFLYFCVHTVKH